METEDHPRKEAEPGRAKCNDLKVTGNSEIQMFKFKIPLYLIASIKIVSQFLNYVFSLPSNTTKINPTLTKSFYVNINEECFFSAWMKKFGLEI